MIDALLAGEEDKEDDKKKGYRIISNSE